MYALIDPITMSAHNHGRSVKGDENVKRKEKKNGKQVHRSHEPD